MKCNNCGRFVDTNSLTIVGMGLVLDRHFCNWDCYSKFREKMKRNGIKEAVREVIKR